MPRTSCLYGNSGDSKTTQLYFVAKWLWETLQLRSRVISYDGKFDQFTLGKPSLRDQGAVQILNMVNSKNALSQTRMLSEGYWPIKTKEGGVYFKADKNCQTIEKDNIGAYLIDGISGLCDGWLVHISDQSPGMGKALTPSFSFEEGGYNFNGTQDSYYGLVQKELMRVIKQNFNTLPVQYVMYTALVEKGVEGFKRRRVPRGGEQDGMALNQTTLYGPKAAGQALTSYLPGWFSDCFHISRMTANVKDGGKQEIRVAWYETHEDFNTEVPYLARVDILPENIVQLREKFKGGFIPLGLKSGVDKFYRFIEEVNG